MKSLFTGIDSSSHTAVSSAQVINSFMSLFYLFISFFVIANFFFKSIAWNFSRIPFPFPFPWFRFRIPDSGFRIPCFSAAVFKREFLCLERFYGRFLHFDMDVKERPQNVRLKLTFCHVLSWFNLPERIQEPVSVKQCELLFRMNVWVFE